MPNTIKFLFWKIGVDIKRYNIIQNSTARFLKILNDFKINLVFDIGANTGQFATELRKIGYDGEIISFEPLSEPYSILQKSATKDHLWKIAERAAIGQEDGEVEINISTTSTSSSILKMLDSHIIAAPNTTTIGKEIVPLKKLDSISYNYIHNTSKLLLKIDTQGYEEQVLKGATETIKKTSVLQVEISLIELYQGQKLFVEMIQIIEEMGFELWGIEPAFINPINGRVLQVDAIFCRSLVP